MEIRSVCVFCGSSLGRKESYAAAADLAGQRLAEEGITLVYGGGRVGMMGRIADSCLRAGGTVIGVITHHLMGLEVGHDGVTELRVVDTMLERKTLMAELSDAFVSLPGGIGTLDEMFEMLTWSQLDIHHKPSGLLNVEGYYDSLTKFLTEIQEAGYVRPEHVSMLSVSRDFDALLAAFRAYQPASVLKKWVER